MVDTDRLKISVDLLALAERDTSLKRIASSGGGEWAGACPFCGGTDRFRVQPSSQPYPRWLCRGYTDGKWRDALDYIASREGLDLNRPDDFQSACEWLGTVKALSRHTEALKVQSAPQGLSKPPDETWQERAREVIKMCAELLWAERGAPARAWLNARGLGDDTLRHWHIGYLPGGSAEWRALAGLSVPCGIVIPGEIDNVVWYLEVRRAQGDPKYTQVCGGHPALFGADTLTSRDTAVLCEGEFDTMLLHQCASDLVGVATLGSASSRLDVATWAEHLLPVSRLLIAYDADAAGEHGATAFAGLTARAHRLRVPTLNELGKDLTDYHKRGGRLRDWLLFELARLEILLTRNITP